MTPKHLKHITKQTKKRPDLPTLDCFRIFIYLCGLFVNHTNFPIMKKLILALVTVAMQLGATAATWTLNGSSYTVDVKATSSLGAGTTLTKAHVYNSSRDMRVFYTVTDLTDPDVAIKSASGSKLTTLSTVETMASNINKSGDATAIAGVNGGFFSWDSGIGGFSVIDGDAQKGFSGDGYYAITATKDNVPSIGYLNQITCWCSNVNGTEGWSDYAAINTTPAYASSCGVGEMLIFYTSEYGSSTGTSGTGGYAVQLTPVNGTKLTPGEYLTYKVTSTPSTGNVTIPSGGIVLYGKGSQNGNYVSGLKSGQEITVYMTVNLKDNNKAIEKVVAHKAVSGSAMILCDGVTISSYPNSLGNISGAEPRTAVGYNADKTKLVMCVVDGRNSGWSEGCNGKILGDIMKNLGCSDALNFDGGGSSQFWTCTEGYVNDPVTNNGGSVRAVGDGFFIVKLPTPVLTASVSSMEFSSTDGKSVSKTFTVSGSDLRGDIAISLSGTDAGMFTISSTKIAENNASGTITVSYNPSAYGNHSATITISTERATSKTIALSGSYIAPAPEPSVSEGLSLVWKNTTVPGSAGGGDVRFAGVSNGKLIANDKANNKIIEITETGYSDYYDPSAAITEYYSQTIGTAIACDDAGNILVNSGFSGAVSGKNFTIISADLKSTYKLDMSTVSGYTAARCDQMGRIVGNMLSDEGAYAFIVPNGATQVLIVKIANGAIDAGYTQLSTACGVALSTSTIAQPAFATVAEIDALMDENGDVSNSFVMRNRSYPQNVYTWKEDASAMEAKSFTNSTAEGYSTKNASSEGFDWFKLGDVSYYIMPLTTDGTTNGRSNAFAIFDGEGNIKAYHAEDLKTGVGQGMGSFIVAPRDNNSVFIYQFMAGTVAKKFIYHNGKTTGVEEIEAAAAADENAPVEYYNLQGIKVKNPSNGIFIKVQGSKVSKVLIRE